MVAQVLAELKLGGIKDDGILFLTSYGTHRPLVQDEAKRKLGSHYADKYAWLNHNIYENLTDIGRTSRGNRIKINRHFMQADVRVTISGIKPHGLAGYGGGAKAILPGVTWVESIHYFHRTIAGVGDNRNKTTGPLKIFKNECRLDMVEAARLARVDFSVQIAYNGYRKVIGVYAGDIVEAHHAACREANRLLRTERARNADVVLVNAYPQNAQAANGLPWVRHSLRDGGTAVLITQNPQGLESMHYARDRWTYDARPFYETTHPSSWDVKQAGSSLFTPPTCKPGTSSDSRPAPFLRTPGPIPWRPSRRPIAARPAWRCTPTLQSSTRRASWTGKYGRSGARGQTGS